MEMGGDVLRSSLPLPSDVEPIFERVWFFRTEHKELVLEASNTWENRAERHGVRQVRGLFLMVQRASPGACPSLRRVWLYVLCSAYWAP